VTRSEHPTHIPIEQLSAFLDQQLTPQEQMLLDAHLHSCEQCRLALADLRATVGLVRALPQPTLPRSFTLPIPAAPISMQAAREEREARQAAGIPARRQPVGRNGLRRSLRFISTIAAVLGLLVILSGLLPAIAQQHNNAASGAAFPSITSQQTTSNPSSESTPQISASHTAGSSGPFGSRGSSPVPSQTPVPQKTTLPGKDSQRQGQSPTSLTLPAFLDPGTIEGRLSLGLALAIVGIIGLLLTRRRYRSTQNMR